MTVPSFFSRLYEIDYSFRSINKQYKKMGIQAFEGDSEAHKTVSETFDLLESIFIYGEEINVLTVCGYDIEKLAQSDIHAWRVLAEVIKEDSKFLSNDTFQWHLFSFHDMILGGTSPLTVVYTNSDVYWLLQEKDTTLYDTCGNPLFTDIRPLYRRGKEFLCMIMNWSYNYLLPPCIKEYIENVKAINKNLTKYDTSELPYHHLSTNYHQKLDVNNVPLLYMKNEEAINKSDLLLSPTKDCTGLLPIVLDQARTSSYIYLYEIPLQNIILPESSSSEENTPLNQRILPLFNIRYPYLTSNDFFEDKLIQIYPPHSSKKLKVEISNKYIIGHIGDELFLLPIKSFFFRFFQPERLDTMLEFMYTGSSYDIKASLHIPLKSGKEILLSKIYSRDDVKILNTINFNFAITPFFQTSKNMLCTLICKKFNCNAEIHFYDSSEQDEVQSKCTSKNDNGILIYSPTERWDVLEIVEGTYRGRIIPLKNHVSKGYPTGQEYLVHIGDIKTEITVKELNHSPYNTLVVDRDSSLLEPLVRDKYCEILGQYSFPIGLPTVDSLSSPFNTCMNVSSNTHNNQALTLFKDANIIFNYHALSFFTQSRNSHIIQNVLSYFLHDNSLESEKLFKLYCEQLTLLMLGYLQKEHDAPYFTLRIVVPSWMKNRDYSIFQDIWIRTLESFSINKEQLLSTSMAESLITTGHLHGFFDNVLYVYIDACHTEIIYHDIINENKCLVLPVNFGTADIYGESIDNNPFIKLVEWAISQAPSFIKTFRELVENGISPILIMDWYKHLSIPFYKNKLVAIEILFFYAVLFYIREFQKQYVFTTPKHLLLCGPGTNHLFNSQEMCTEIFHDFASELARVDDNAKEWSKINIELFDFQPVYNDRTQKINFEYCNAYGFSINNEISPKDIYHQTSNYIEKQFVAFLDLLTSNKVSCVLDNYSGVNIQENIASLYELALVKYREECYEYELCNKKTQGEVKEPFFLWTLKKPLALFAKEIR